MPVELYGPVAGGGAQTVQTQNCVDVTLAGNSTSAGAGFILISSGTMTLAGGNNITLSQNGNIVSILGAAAGTGGGISGISAGTQLGTSGTISFANSNNISFGLSGSSVLTASYSGITGGVSSGGNTAGTTGTVTNGLLFFGGNNVTLSQSSGAGGATVSFVGASTHSFTGGVSTGGNTLGTTGTVSNGILFVGGTNITLSQSSAAGGATVTVIGPAPGTTQSAQTGISGIAGSGASTVTAGTVQFANSNNITFGLNGSTMTASYSQSLQTSGLFQGTIAGNSTSAGAGYILLSSGTVTLAGGNNITISQNGNALTFSGPNIGGAQTGISSIQASDATYTSGAVVFTGSNIITVKSGTGQAVIIDATVPLQTGISGIAGSAASTVTAGTVQFANSNGVSFGLNGSTMTASISPAGTFNVLSASGNTTGTLSSQSTGTIVLAGGNNITLSQNSNSITISGANIAGTMSQWIPPGVGFSTFSQLGQSSLVIFPAQLAMYGSFSRADLFASISLSTSSNSSFSGIISIHAGVYTRNVSTLSRATSASTSYGWNVTGSTSSVSYVGLRDLSIALAPVMTPGEYFIGILSMTATTNANWATLSNMGLELINAAYSGPFSVSTAASNQFMAGMGIYSAQTAAMPSAIGFSDLLGTSAGTFRPIINLLNYTA